MLEHLLYQAAEYGDCHDIRLLVDEYGAKEEPVLRYQICRRWWYSRTHTPSTRLIRLMADKGSFLEKPHHRFFRKILMRASRYGWIEWVKLMPDWGVDVNCRHARTRALNSASRDAELLRLLRPAEVSTEPENHKSE